MRACDSKRDLFKDDFRRTVQSYEANRLHRFIPGPYIHILKAF